MLAVGLEIPFFGRVSRSVDYTQQARQQWAMPDLRHARAVSTLPNPRIDIYFPSVAVLYLIRMNTPN